MATTMEAPAPAGATTTLPRAGLLALFTAGFLGILNETVPAGLLPQIADSLGISESLAGQTITVYALATAATAIPLNARLEHVDRRTLLAGALATYALANAAIAIVDDFAVIMVARFFAGVGAGLIWSNIGGIAARIAPTGRESAGIAVAMAGIPAALSLGLPAGTLLGDAVGWQATFGVSAAVSVGLIGWMFAALPALPGGAAGDGASIPSVLRRPGVRAIVLVVLGYYVAHNLLYSYIGPLAIGAGIGDQIEVVLLVFGVGALLSIWGTGKFVEPHHRRLMVASVVAVGASALVLRFALVTPALLYVGAAAWGIGFGGSAALFLTAGIRAAGSDNIQSVLVTVINVSIAAGGVVGGLLLADLGVSSIPVVAFALMVPTAVATVVARRHAFPRWTA